VGSDPAPDEHGFAGVVSGEVEGCPAIRRAETPSERVDAGANKATDTQSRRPWRLPGKRTRLDGGQEMLVNRGGKELA